MTHEGSFTLKVSQNPAIYGDPNLIVEGDIWIGGNNNSDLYGIVTVLDADSKLYGLPTITGGSDTILTTSSSDEVINKSITSSSNTVYAKGLFSQDTAILINTSSPSDNYALLAVSSSEATWQQINHTNLTNIGTNTHAQIDSHIANQNNPHNVTLNQITPNTNKGELIVFNGSDSVSLPTSSDDYVLTLDSTQPNGIKWAESVGGVTFVDWTSWTPSDIAGHTITTIKESRYSRIGNTVHINLDMRLTSNVSSDTITVSNLPININLPSDSTIGITSFIRNVSDSAISIGNIELKEISSDRFNIYVANWGSGKVYDIQTTFVYPV